jgi:hypothetical protein
MKVAVSMHVIWVLLLASLTFAVHGYRPPSTAFNSGMGPTTPQQRLVVVP